MKELNKHKKNKCCTLNRFFSSKSASMIISLFAIVGFLIMIVMMLYFSSSSSHNEREIKEEIIYFSSLKDFKIELDSVLRSTVEKTIYETIEEVANHGGYRDELIPPLTLGKIPYWFYEGHLSQIPSHMQMQQMINLEAESRFFEEIKSILQNEKYKNHGLQITLDSLSIKIYNYSVEIDASINLDYRFDNVEQEQQVTPHFSLPLRIGYLRDLMEEMYHFLDKNETLERHFIYFMRQDPRFPVPEGFVELICKDEYITKEMLRRPIFDNLKLSVSQTLVHIREDNKFKDREILWVMEGQPRAVEYSFTDEFGNKNMIKKEASRNYPCPRTWKAYYNFTFPIKLSLIDLRKDTRLTFGKEEQIATALEFKTMFHGRINKNNVLRTEKGESEKYCQGACSLILTIVDSEGQSQPIDGITIDICDYNNVTGELKETVINNVPCGVVTLHVIPKERNKYFITNKQLSLHPEDFNSIKLNLTEIASVSGVVTKSEQIYCDKHSESGCKDVLISKNAQKLKYIDGDPPGYVRIVFRSLDKKELLYTTITDRYGKYNLTDMESGQYILAAYSSYDTSNNLAYKIFPIVRYIKILPGHNHVPLPFKPLNPLFINDKSYLVDKVDACTSC